MHCRFLGKISLIHYFMKKKFLFRVDVQLFLLSSFTSWLKYNFLFWGEARLRKENLQSIASFDMAQPHRHCLASYKSNETIILIKIINVHF